MSKADDIFYREFLAVLVLLVLFAFFAYFVASAIGENAFQARQSSPQAVLDRIAPAAQVRVGEPGETVAAAKPAEEPAAEPEPAPAVADAGSGAEVYNNACMACHATGAANAPKVGDKEAWQPRAEQGMDILIQSAIKGKGAMPPKGGYPNLTEDQIKGAIRYMLDETGVSAG